MEKTVIDSGTATATNFVHTDNVTTGYTISTWPPQPDPLNVLEDKVALLMQVISGFQVDPVTREYAQKALSMLLHDYFGEITDRPDPNADLIAEFNRFRNRERI